MDYDYREEVKFDFPKMIVYLGNIFEFVGMSDDKLLLDYGIPEGVAVYEDTFERLFMATFSKNMFRKYEAEGLIERIWA